MRQPASILILGLGVMGCAPRGASTTSPASNPDPADRAEVIAAVQGTFDAMRTHDVEALRALVMPGAIIVPVRAKDGVVTAGLVTDEQFIAGTAGDGPSIDERLLGEPEVRVDGPLATVWAPYEVYVDGARIHCGVDAIQLAQLDGHWRITAITYTADPDGCPDEVDSDQQGRGGTSR